MAKRRSPVKTFTLEKFEELLRNAGATEAFILQFGDKLKQFSYNYALHLKNQLVMKRIGVTGELYRSIYGRSIVFQDGNAKTGAVFNLYGIYVNKGAGKGIMVSERQMGRGLTSSRSGVSKRVPKPWLDDGIAKYTVKLEQLLNNEGAEIVEQVIAAQLQGGIKSVVVEL